MGKYDNYDELLFNPTLLTKKDSSSSKQMKHDDSHIDDTVIREVQRFLKRLATRPEYITLNLNLSSYIPILQKSLQDSVNEFLNIYFVKEGEQTSVDV